MKCNASGQRDDSFVLAFQGSIGVGLAQPIERIYLDSVDPYFPVQMRSRNPTGPTHQSNHLTRFHHISHIHKLLGLVPEATIDPPAMIDDRCVASNSERRRKHYFTGCRGKDLESLSTAKVETRMEAWQLSI